MSRSYGGFTIVWFKPSAFEPVTRGMRGRAAARRRGVTDVDEVSVRLPADQHERRNNGSGQTGHEKRGDFDGEGLGARDERDVALGGGGRGGIVHLVVLHVCAVQVFIQRR